MKKLKNIAFCLAGCIVFLLIFSLLAPPKVYYAGYAKPSLAFWQIRSIDTMKYSRDLSREKINDPNFDEVIDRQVRDIAAVGATHVAVGTPYDKEFIPMLVRWVGAARKYGLKVWFRGNFSGWEKWFGYKSITREEHIGLVREFIVNNPDLFEDGDIFSSCPECENGGAGDPRETGDIEEYREFLIEEYREARLAFQAIKKNVDANYFSMNGDVAKLIMDKKTTAAFGGLVVIDHYVETPEKLLKDVENLAVLSGGKIVLGEFGAPIPDINGKMTHNEQAQWISRVLALVADSDEIIGLNYWLNVGGSTEIWTKEGEALPAVEKIREFFKPELAYGTVLDSLDRPIAGAEISNSMQTVFTDKNGYFEIPVIKSLSATLQVSARGFRKKENVAYNSDRMTNIILTKENTDILFDIRSFIKNKLN